MGTKSVFQPGSRWLIGGAAVASLAIAAFGLSQFLSPQAERKPAATPVVSPTPQAVTALGRIEPAGEVIDVSGPKGDRIRQLLVIEGQYVRAGQPLAYLEDYQERLAERDLAANQLREAQTKLGTETSYGQAQIREAQSRLEVVAQPKSAAILAQQATINRITAELAAAKRDQERLTQLRQEGAISQQALDDKNLIVESKQAELANARSTLSQLQQQRATELNNAQAQLQSAQANLQRSQAQVQIASATSNLQLANAKLERTVIRAPQRGQVLKVYTRTGEAIGDQGILQMGNTQQMYVVAEVYETDIARVKVGQPATITSSAFANELQGQVEQVGLRVGKNDVLSTDPAANTDVRVVEVRIRLIDSQPVAQLTNLQVNVAIQPATGQPVSPLAAPTPNGAQ